MPDPDFKLREAIPEGYEQYATAFNGAINQDQVNQIRRNIDENLEIRERRDARGVGSTLGSDLIAGIVDPLTLVPGAKLVGVGARVGAVKGAITVGGLGAASEVVRVGADDTATVEEGVYGAVGSLALGGAVGAVVGKIGATGAKATRRTFVPASIPAPLGNARVTSGYGARGAFRGKRGAASTFHKGVDLWAEVGTPLKAQRDARVVSIQENDVGKAGRYVELDLGGGVVTKVLHLDRVNVKPGQTIKAGTVYALSGNSGNSTGPHVHYSMTVNGKSVDPFSKKAFEASGEVIGPQATAISEGLAIPHQIEIDGRGVPVILGPTGAGAPARFVRGKAPVEVVEEVVNEIEAGSRPISNSVDDLSEGLGNIGRGIGDSLRDRLLERVERGLLTEMDGGSTSPVMQVAQALRVGGVKVDRDVLSRIGEVVNDARGKPDFQQRLRTFIDQSTTREVGAGQPPVAPALDPRFEGLGPMPLAEAKALAARFAQEEGLTGRAATTRAKALMIEMKNAVTGGYRARLGARPKGYAEGDLGDDGFDPSITAAQRLRDRADAAALRGDDDLADTLFEQADDLDSRLSGERDDLLGQRDRARAKVDEDVALQRQADREAGAGDPYVTRDQARDAMRSSEADDLPFGMSHGDSAPHAEDGDHFRIDVDAILNSFDDKPWTRANMEGVTPYPEDTFRNPQQWLDFVVNHEVEHSVNPIRAGESLADYENRINARALEQLRNGQRPFSPDQGMLERLAVRPTPRGQLQELLKGHEDTEMVLALGDLADDFAVQTIRGQQGAAHAVGGSVFQRVAQWQAKQYPVRDAIRRQYLKMLGVPEGASRFQIEAAIAVRKIPGVRKSLDGVGTPTLDDFRREVARAVVGGGEVSTFAAAAAAEFTAIMRTVEIDARELGLFRSVKGLTARADRLDRRAARVDASLERVRVHAEGEDWFTEMTEAAARMRDDALELRAKAQETVMPHRETSYYPRHWNVDALLANETEAIQMLERGYRREGHENPEFAARGAFDLITQEPSGEFAAPGSPSSLQHRSIPVTNQEAFDFIVQDAELVMSVYLRRMGGAIEMTRRYGDAFALDEIDMLRADMLGKGVPREKAEQALQLFEDARDRIVGGFHGKDPLSWDNRAVRALKGAVNLAVMGKVIFSQVGDIARTIGVVGLGARQAVTGQGPGGLIGGIYAGIVGDLSRYNPGGIAKVAGEALELVNARNVARLIENDDALIVTRDTAFERWIARAQTPFFIANGMIPFTVILKEWAGVVAAHNIIDEARLVAAAVQAGEAPDPKLVGRLADSGIDVQDAQILAAMPTEQGKSGLHLANVMAWEGERGARARSMLLAAVQGEVRRAVTTPGPLDRPAIFDGIFHSKKGREAALQNVQDLRRVVLEREADMVALRGREEGDPDVEAALEALGKAKGELNQARRNVGRAGRKEMPIASLPFQMHSFSMAAGSKILHGLLSRRDRARAAGYASLVIAGALSTWLKAGDGFDNMEWDEFIAQSFENSGAGAWMADLITNVDQALDSQMYPGNEFDEDGEQFGDEISPWAPALGLGAKLVEPFVNSGLEQDDRVRMIRRALPFNNLLGMSKVFDLMQDVLDGDTREIEQNDPDAVIGSEGSQSASMGGGRYGATVPDLRAAPPAGPSETVVQTGTVEAAPGAALPALPTRAQLKASKGKKKKRPVVALL